MNLFRHHFTPIHRPALIGAFWLAALAGPVISHAQEFEGQTIGEAKVLTDLTHAVPGEPLMVGILFEMAPKWHIYWEYAGDSGMPTTVNWDLPERVEAGPLRFPAPYLYEESGDIITYAYGDEVLLLTQIDIAEDFEGKELKLKGEARWLICREVCIPGKHEFELTLPVGTLDDARPQNSELFVKYLERLPIRGPLEGMPFEEFAWERDEEANLFRLTLTGTEFPESAKLTLFPLPPEQTGIIHPQLTTAVEADELVFEIEIIDAPEEVKEFPAVLVAGYADGARQSWRVERIAEGLSDNSESSETGEMAAAGSDSDGDGDEQAAAATGSGDGGAGVTSGAAPMPFWIAGLLGGLILNIMPCVLPAISIKILSFTQMAGENRKKIAAHGLAFTAGIFVFFLGFAGILQIIKAGGDVPGWGEQFGNPYFLVPMMILLLVFALNLFGVFELVLPGNITQSIDSLAGKSGYIGSFWHGAFATLLGSACAAPIMAVSLGAMMGADVVTTFIFFGAMAVGMSLPYLLLSLFPGWLSFLPKPGPWMEHFKQFMGFVLLGFVGWLFVVYTQITEVNAAIAMSFILAAIAVGFWFFGSVAHRSRGKGPALARLASVIVLASIVGVLFLQGGTFFTVKSEPAGSASFLSSEDAAVPDYDHSGGIEWVAWSPEAVEKARAQGRTIFIDFTAAWCFNCIVNKQKALEVGPTRKLFTEHNVVALKADMTGDWPEAWEAVRSYDRNALPTNVVYGPGMEGARVLPVDLTKSNVAEAIQSAEQRDSPTAGPGTIAASTAP